MSQLGVQDFGTDEQKVFLTEMIVIQQKTNAAREVK